MLIGKGSSYHMEIRNHFIKAYFDIFSYVPDGELAMQPYFIVGDTNIHVSYFSFSIICFMILFLLIEGLSRINGNYSKRLKIIGFSYLILFVLWELGMLIAYLFEFHESSANKMDSYSRYTNVFYLSLTIVLICGIVYLFKYCVPKKNKQIVFVVGLCILLLLIPKYDVYRIASRFAEYEGNRREELTDKYEYYRSLSEKTAKE